METIKPKNLGPCIASTCTGYRNTEPIRLFRIPESDVEAWCHNLQVDIKTLNTKSRVCSRHFHANEKGRQKLKIGARPTLNLGHNNVLPSIIFKMPKWNHRKCSILGCSTTSPPSTVFQFPEDPKKAKLWTDNYPLKKDPESKFKKYICAKHFDKSMIGKGRLLSNAVPKMVKSDLISQVEELSVEPTSPLVLESAVVESPKIQTCTNCHSFCRSTEYFKNKFLEEKSRNAGLEAEHQQERLFLKQQNEKLKTELDVWKSRYEEISAKNSYSGDNEEKELNLHTQICHSLICSEEKDHIITSETSFNPNKYGYLTQVKDEFHETEQIFQCGLCVKSFFNENDLVTHISTHDGKMLYKCETCLKDFTSQYTLTLHMRTHTGERPYDCELCSKSFVQKGHLKNHLLSHTEERPFSCEICEKSFKCKIQRYRHMRTHTGERLYKCEICSKSYIQKSKLQMHLLSHTEERPFSCEICLKSFIQKANLKSHLLTHTEKRPFNCEICSKSFIRKTQLKSHQLNHTEERPFKCELCEEIFKSKEERKLHMGTHVDDRPFKCEICSKSFIRKPHLKTHLSIHNPERSFKCELCEKFFKSKEERKLHMRIHVDDSPFKCEICSKSFIRKPHLKNHLRTHSVERPFKCELCDKCFNSDEKRKVHMGIHVDDRPSE